MTGADTAIASPKTGVETGIKINKKTEKKDKNFDSSIWHLLKDKKLLLTWCGLKLMPGVPRGPWQNFSNNPCKKCIAAKAGWENGRDPAGPDNSGKN